MSAESEKELNTAIAGVLFNASNYPSAVQSRMLGQDIGPLTGRVMTAVTGWLVEHDRQVIERTLLDAADAVLAPHPDPETCTAVFDPWDVDEFLRARIPATHSIHEGEPKR